VSGRGECVRAEIGAPSMLRLIRRPGLGEDLPTLDLSWECCVAHAELQKLQTSGRFAYRVGPKKKLGSPKRRDIFTRTHKSPVGVLFDSTRLVSQEAY